MKLSIIIPVFNEEKTIGLVLEELSKLNLEGFEKEIIVVNDGSKDSSKTKIQNAKDQLKLNNLKLLSHRENIGKGAAIKTALKEATGGAIIIQDADLEYRPEEISQLIFELEDKNIDAVFGSRNINPDRRGYPHYVLGVALLSALTNLLYNSRLTDVYTGYKLIRSDVFKKLSLESDGFEIEAEITSKLLRRRYKIMEVPISYFPRKFKEGKKIRFKDAIIGFWTILKNRFTRIN